MYTRELLQMSPRDKKKKRLLGAKSLRGQLQLLEQMNMLTCQLFCI